MSQMIGCTCRTSKTMLHHDSDSSASDQREGCCEKVVCDLEKSLLSTFACDNYYIFGGGKKKAVFDWSEITENLLLECHKHVIDNAEKPIKKRLMLRFTDQLKLNDIKYVKSSITEGSIFSKVTDLKSEKTKEKKNMKWTAEIDKILVECGIEARHRYNLMKNTNQTVVPFGEQLYDQFIVRANAINITYNGGINNLTKRFNELLEDLSDDVIENVCQDVQTEIDAQVLEEDKSSTVNMPTDTNQTEIMKKWHQSGIDHGKQDIYVGVCYNCGMLLFGDKLNKRYVLTSVKPKATVEERYTCIPKNLSYKYDREKWFVCKLCSNNPEQVLRDFDITNSTSGLVEVPKELECIKAPNELSDIALIGTYYVPHTNRDPLKRRFVHHQGEVNLMSKGDRAYLTLLGSVIEKAPVDLTSYRTLSANVIKALRWLKKNNHLYKKFYANCETVLRYIKQKNALLLGGDLDLKTVDGKALSAEMGKEQIGMWIPQEKYDADIPEDEDFVVGTTHPKTSSEYVKELVRPGLNSPYLEALAFPKLFPSGTGSYNPKGSLKPRDWIKLILLNLDGRFRQNHHLIFFELNRYIKNSMMAQQAVRMRAVGSGADHSEKVTARALKEGGTKAYERYGAKVPANIPGSRSYWWQAQQELHAITVDIGRRPTYFVTITTNDNWPEIQRVARHGPGNSCDECANHEDEHGVSAVDCAVECSIAFHQRWLKYKRENLEQVGELGEVERYWYRREYQKRGAVHVHLAVWIKNGCTSSNVVMAEMPRGGCDLAFTEELRGLVRKFQIHKCFPELCLRMGNKVLKTCRYGFPYKIPQYSTVQEDNGFRKLYRRRCAEDSNVSPYSVRLLTTMRAHVNVQEVSSNGWEMYLSKYMSKPEPTVKVSYGRSVSRKASDVEKFLNMRVVGIVEACDVLLQFPAKGSNVDVVYLPVEVEATEKIMKRKIHLPKEPDSVNIFYPAKIDRYLDRPKEYAKLTYPEFYRRYKYVTKRSEEDDDENREAFEDENEKEARIEQRKIFERKKRAVIRYPFLLPYGVDQEKYCLKLLLDKYPWDRESIKKITFDRKEKNPYLKYCVENGVWSDRETCMEFLESAKTLPFDKHRLMLMATKMREGNYLTDKDFVEYEESVRDRERNEYPEILYDNDVEDDEAFKLRHLAKMNLRPVEEYQKSFTDEQRAIFAKITGIIERKKQALAAIFGPAGTGKSFMLQALCSYALSDAASLKFHVLAPTGTAAYLIKGRTIHSFLCMDINNKSHLVPGSVEAAIVRDADLVLIDEMSMISEEVFEELDRQLSLHAKDVAKSVRPHFGGKHVILFGDSAQLPSYGNNVLFSLPLFHRVFNIFRMKEIVRQEDDTFRKMLNEARSGELSVEAVEYFDRRKVAKIDYDDVIARNLHVLVSLRKTRDAYNQELLSKIEGEERTYLAVDTDMANAALREDQRELLEKKLKGKVYPYKLTLRVGALVMLLRNLNLELGLVNGRTAVVKELNESYVMCETADTKEPFPVTKCKQTIMGFGRNEKYIRHQIPLDLGWAVTIHKVQGQTMDDAYMQLDEKIFASGQAYVALSRVRKYENLRLIAFEPKSVFLKPFYKELLRWIEEHDMCNENKNLEYPMPNFDKKIIYDEDACEEGKKTVEKKKEIEELIELLSLDVDSPRVDKGFKRQASKDMPADIEDTSKSLKTTYDDLRLPSLCDRMLKQMIVEKTYTADCLRLREFFEERSELCEVVDEFLSGAGTQVTVAKVDAKNKKDALLYDLDNYEQVPREMLAEYRGAKVAGDGNCWYYAVSTALFGTSRYMSLLRFASVRAMLNHERYFRKHATQWYSSDEDGPIMDATNRFMYALLNTGSGTNIKDLAVHNYGQDVRLEGTRLALFCWADNVSMLATQIAVNRPIATYSNTGYGGMWIAHSRNVETVRPLFVLHNTDHFEAIIPRNEDAPYVKPRAHNLMMNRRGEQIYVDEYVPEDG